MAIKRSKKARAARLLSLCLFLAAVFSLLGCTKQSLPVFVLKGETMGTYYEIKVVDPGKQVTTPQLQKVTDDALIRINNMMSTYIPDSELMRFNRSELKEWVEVSEPLFEVLAISDRISALTGGAFDITVAPLVNLWGFGPGGVTEPPNEQAVRETLRQVGYKSLELDPEAFRVRRLKDVQLDLSAVAKGYGADYLAQIYSDMNLDNFMIEIGGELRLQGHNPKGKPWRIGVEAPSLNRSGVVQAVELTGVGMATSGDYRNYYEVDGKRVSHTIDPTTGAPITHSLASATVIAGSAAEADALATAFNVLGAERARALAEEHGIAVYFIERQNGEFVSTYTGAFEQYMF